MFNLARRVFLAFGLALTCTSPATADGTNIEPPCNVIVIVADDLGWADLGCYGADLHESPNLDQFAESGTRFTDAYAASVCSPTRASLLTGKHYARLGITMWREASREPPRDRKLISPVSVADLPHSEVTLAEVFRSAGYLTATVGKWHLGDAKYYPETQGFDINIGGTLWGAPASHFFPYRGTGRFEGEFRYVPQLDRGKQGEYLTDRLTDEALKVIDRAEDRPFFLYLAHHAVHTPIEAKPELVERYEKKQVPGLHHRNPKYAAMVHSLDESVGRVLERLESRGLSERTVVVFVSDNGGHVIEYDGMQITDNHPLRSGKGSLYEGGIRVPLIIRWPGIGSGGRVCRQPVYVADLFPTLLEIAGLKNRNGRKTKLDGQSLTPLLKNPDAKLVREALYFHYPHYYPTTTPVSAIRAGDWKLLEYHEDNRIELYNLRDDLGEAKDLAANQREKAQDLRARLADWRTAVGAKLPTRNPDFRQQP
ncbi:MAG: sulfatase [Planctomycetes bacterium]|nr:sulfatase [Planctomycetota bacterium]